MKTYFAGTLVDRTLARWRQALLAALLLALLLTTMPATPAAHAATTCTVAASGAMYTTIQAAVNNTTCTTINVAAGTYIENVQIGRDVTINGSTSGTTIVDGHNAGSVFNVQSGTVTLANLTIQHGSGNPSNGYTFGGGIDNSGTLTVSNTTLSGNSAQYGGGIYNQGTLTVTNTTLSGNRGHIMGGGIANAYGTLNVANSTLSSNSAASYGGGIAGQGGTLSVTKSTLSGNSTGDQGGGIYIAGTATSTVTNSTLSGNSAASFGGGILNTAGTLTVTDSTFSDNSAQHGGGIANGTGTLNVANSTFSGNSGPQGGGIFNNGTLSVANSTFSRNSGGCGGGIYIFTTATSTVTNSTFSGNSTTNYGGGICLNKGPLTVTNSTFSGNSTTNYGGGGIYTSYSLTTLTLVNSIVANSPRGGDCSGSSTPTSHHNLMDDTGCGLTNGTNGNIVGPNPQLGPLQNNGGPTQTYALLSGSPAINAGSDADCPAADQRGVVRPTGAHCDIGAYEWEWTDTTAPETTITTNPSKYSTSPAASFAFAGTDDSSGVASYACSLDGATFSACTSPQSYSGLTEGGHTFQVRAIDVAGNTDASPAFFDWKIDTIAPGTTIMRGPFTPSSSPIANFDVTGRDDKSGIASFECSLDNAAFTACPTSQRYTGLADGSHTFQARAIDPAGNIDPTPASFSWKIDTIAPETTMTIYPSNLSTSSAASFAFTGTDDSSGVTKYACSLDGAAFTACTSPQSYSGLANGSHLVQVRAIDGAGNVDATPASYTWTISVPTATPTSAPISTPTNTPVPPTSTPTVSAPGA